LSDANIQATAIASAQHETSKRVDVFEPRKATSVDQYTEHAEKAVVIKRDSLGWRKPSSQSVDYYVAVTVEYMIPRAAKTIDIRTDNGSHEVNGRLDVQLSAFIYKRELNRYSGRHLRVI
jgi:hypothetical protein